MYVPMAGTNCATMPVHSARASHDGSPMMRNTMAVAVALTAASTRRALT